LDVHLDAQRSTARQAWKVVWVARAGYGVTELALQQRVESHGVERRDEQIDVADRSRARGLSIEKPRRSLQREKANVVDGAQCGDRRELLVDQDGAVQSSARSLAQRLPQREWEVGCQSACAQRMIELDRTSLEGEDAPPERQRSVEDPATH
jgi:hypothetical protein